jgi:hypothetical protein
MVSIKISGKEVMDLETEKVIQREKLGKELRNPSPRRGTWFSLGLLAAVIIITYIIFFGLYTSRI